jgi:4-alpha-glucanotransferase
MRKTGILMPVSSLPSRTGAGDFGKEAYHLVDLLRQNGVKIWQILPLNPLGYGNSPYQPYSSYAGDDLYISLDTLYDIGLLSERASEFRSDSKRVNYPAVRSFREPYLRQAFRRFVGQKGQRKLEYEEFANQSWVQEYGVFRALKKANNGDCWNLWRADERDWPLQRKQLPDEILEEAEYHIFLQYMFYEQWMQLKAYANEAEIEIMGDVPFYVGVDSVDVWAGRENFLLDAQGKPTFIAGVPPDYFSATGQRWGNPIYNWEHLKETQYRFWVERIGYSSRLFDIVRIDHFRAFDTFWKIPVRCETAIEGEWIEAPGYEVLDTLYREIPKLHLVAEDLGDLRPEVLVLRDAYQLKGMKVLQFCLQTNQTGAYDSFTDTQQMIIYTGTHDNDTMKEWFQKLSVVDRQKIRRFFRKAGYKKGTMRDRWIAYTLASQAEFAILPMADLIGLGKKGHINVPGTVGSPNWEWRLPNWKKAEKALEKYRCLLMFRPSKDKAVCDKKLKKNQI